MSRLIHMKAQVYYKGKLYTVKLSQIRSLIHFVSKSCSFILVGAILIDTNTDTNTWEYYSFQYRNSYKDCHQNERILQILTILSLAISKCLVGQRSVERIRATGFHTLVPVRIVLIVFMLFAGGKCQDWAITVDALYLKCAVSCLHFAAASLPAG